jgi:hypothetical protein
VKVSIELSKINKVIRTRLMGLYKENALISKRQDTFTQRSRFSKVEPISLRYVDMERP